MGRRKKISLTEDTSVFGSAFSSLEFEALAPDLEMQEEQPSPQGGIVRVRLEKKGRGGKQVTVFYDFEPLLEDATELAKELRKHLGVGGKFCSEEACIEIQGDQRSKAANYLSSKGFTVKGQLS